MVISSLVVNTLPASTQQVEKALSAMRGVEVHETHEYKLVVTIEADTLSDSSEIANSFMKVEGVIGVHLVYANFEDDPSLSLEYR